MKGKQAFTLIELLVVVLIIGILAAVALPQYQKAVEKSRVSTLLAAMKTIADAQDAYYLANGEYSQDIDTLSVDMPAGTEKLERNGYISHKLPSGSKISFITDYDNIIYGATSRIQIDWILPHGTGSLMPTGIYCGADPTDAVGISVCKSFGSQGQKTGSRGCGAFTSSPILCDWYQISL